MTAPGGDQTNANVVLSADVSNYQQNMGQAQSSTDKLVESVTKANAAVDGLFKSAGKKLELFSAGSMASIGAAVGVLANLQQSMSQISATASLTGGTSVPKLTQGLQQLSTTVPVSTQQLVSLATTIQGLGVRGTGDILKLTDTFTKLGAATGTSPQVLANNLIQLTRSMGQGIDPNQMQRYAGSVATLSANLGTSAEGITQFAQGIQPFGRLMGLSETQILGVAGAFSKAGAEGGVATNAFNQLSSMLINGLKTGNPQLQDFASLVGMTTKNFTEMGKQNPQQAIVKIFDALKQGGPQAIRTLQGTFGLEGIRTLNAIQRVAQGGGLQRALGLSEQGANQPEKVGQAAAASWNDFYDQLQKIGHSITALVSGPFGLLLDVLTKITSGIASVVGFFEKLANNPVVHWLAQVAGLIAPVVAAIGGMAGAVLILLPLLAKLGIAWQLIGRSSLAVSAGFRAGAAGIATTSAVAGASLAARGGYGIGALAGTGARMVGYRPGEGGGTSLVGTAAAGGLAASRYLGRTFYTGPAGLLVSDASAAMRGGVSGVQANMGINQNAGFWARQQAMGSRMLGFLPFVGGRGGGAAAEGAAAEGAAGRIFVAGAGGTTATTGAAAKEMRNVSESANKAARGFETVDKRAVGMSGAFAGTSKAATASAEASAAAARSSGAVAETGAAAARSLGATAAAGARAALGLAGSAAAGIGRFAGGLVSSPLGLALTATMLAPPIINAIKGANKPIDQATLDRSPGTFVGNMNAFNTATGQATTSLGELTASAMKAAKQLPGGGEGAPAGPFSKEEIRAAVDSSFKVVGYDPSSHATTMEKTAQLQQAVLGDLSRGKALTDDQQREFRQQLEHLYPSNIPQAKRIYDSLDQFTQGFTKMPTDTQSIFKIYSQMGQNYAENVGRAAPVPFRADEMSAGSQRSRAAIVDAMAAANAASITATLPAQQQMIAAQFLTMMNAATRATAGQPMTAQQRAETRLSLAQAQGVDPSMISRAQVLASAPGARSGASTQFFKDLASKMGLPGDIGDVNNVQDFIANMFASKDANVKGTARRLFGPQGSIDFSDPDRAQRQIQARMDDARAQLGIQTQQERQRAYRQYGLGNFGDPWAQVQGIRMGTPLARQVTATLGGSERASQVLPAISGLATAFSQSGASVADSQRNFEAWIATLNQADPAVKNLIQGVRQLMDTMASMQESTQNLPTQFTDITNRMNAINKNAPGGAEQFQNLQQQRQQLVQQGVSQAQQYLMAQDQLHTQLTQQEYDYNLTVTRMRTQFNLQQERQEQQHDLQIERTNQDFHTMMARQEQQYEITVSRMIRNNNLQMDRAETQHNLQRKRAYQDYQISVTQAMQDHETQRARMQRDFIHQEQQYILSVANTLDPYAVVQSQNVADAYSTLQNVREQNTMYQNAGKQLDALRKMGLSQRAIDMLGLSDPKNIQQLQKFFEDVSNNPALINTFNRTMKNRFDWTKGLAVNKSSTQWRETEYQFKTMSNDFEDDFDRAMKRGHAAFTRTMDRDNQDFRTNIQNTTHDFSVSLSDMAADNKRTRDQEQTDHERQLRRDARDFKTLTGQQKDDFHTQLQNMADDEETQVDRMMKAINHIATNAYGTNEQIMNRALNLSKGNMKTYFQNVLDLYREFVNQLPTASSVMGGTPTPGVGQAGAAAGYTGRAGQIAQALASHGYNATAIAGILGNLKQESGFDPTAVNPNGGASGIAQWMGPRLTALKSFANKRGTSWTDLDTQIAFMLQEAGGRGIRGELNAAGGPTAAAMAWKSDFEGVPGMAQLGNRLIYALEFYNQNKAAQPRRPGRRGGGNVAEHYPVSGALTTQRTDQGKDWSGTGPLYAVASGKILSTHNSGWPGGTFINLELDHPMGKGRTNVFYAEYITPTVRIGEHVRAGDIIGHAHGGIEIGWAAPRGPYFGDTLAKSRGHDARSRGISSDPGEVPSREGIDFVRWINSIMSGGRGRAGQHGRNIPAQHGAIFSGMSNVMLGEGGPEAVLPLNERGADFVLTLMRRTNEQAWASRLANSHYATRVEPTVQNTHIDSSTNFTGAVTVQANDPNQMAEALKQKARMAALTNPDMARSAM